MHDHHDEEPNYGTGQKKLGIYIVGLLLCSALTLLSFWVVMAGQLTKWEIFAIIYLSACIQFLVQVICFLRLNIQTVQAKTNVLTLVFTGVVLTTIIVGSLWIMSNLHFNMMN